MGVDIPHSKPAAAKATDIASLPIPDTLAALQQDPRGGPHGRCAHGHRADVRGSPGTPAIALGQTFAIFVYAMVACLVVNDAVKVAMNKWRIPTAAG